MGKVNRKKAPAAYKKAKQMGKMKAPRATQPMKAPRKQRSAEVTLKIGGRGGGTFKGLSSGQFGHAEMSALTKFLMKCNSFDQAWDILEAAKLKTITCPNQPICVSCTIIMKDVLGFKAPNFSNKPSGGVDWGCSNKVKDFLTYHGKSADLNSAIARGRH